MERREHTRFRAQDDAYAVLGGAFSKVGKVYDISLNGLAFTYLEDKISNDTFTHVDVFLSGNGFYLSSVPCTIVYNANEPISDANAVPPFRCGLKFESLEAEHEDKLTYFLNHHVIGEGEENRSQKTEDRRQKDRIQNTGARSQEPEIRGPKTKDKGLFSKIEPTKPGRYDFLMGLIGFLLLNIALIGVQLIKRGNLELSSLYIKLTAVFYLVWLGTSLTMKKFKQIVGKPFFESFVLIVKSNIVIVFLVSFSIVLWAQLAAASRMQTFGVCGALFLLEVLGLIVGYTVFKNKFTENRTSDQNKTASASIYRPLVFIDAVLLMSVFLAINCIKRGSFDLPNRYDQVILVLYALLLVSSFLVKKYDKKNFDSTYLKAVTPCIKATLIIGGSLAVIVFSLRLFYFSRLHLFGTFALLFILELMVYYVYFAYRKYGKLGEDIETADEVTELFHIEDRDRHLLEEGDVCTVGEPVEIKLKHTLEFFNEILFHFIKKNIDLSTTERCSTAIMSTDEIEDVQKLDNKHHQLFINLHKTNDVRWFNRYFLEVYGHLKARGYFVGKAHTITTRKKHYMAKYPRVVATLFYYANFVWCRVFPKLPYIKKIYFTFTRGRNRMVSKSEIFGRLCFCGFKIVDELEIDNQLFFIAQKVKQPSLNKNPSYGPIVQLTRSGFNGNMITVYKFRTMYPYSEFLQEYIYEKNQLDEGGKFKNDIRVTDWGKFMRAVWLDELPMIYNWLKGDLKLFGVRPLSRQYLSLYTKELQELRKKVVPGLIPPFYADLPETLPEIIESELRYIEEYLKKPIKTQAKYTWKSGKNIILNGARSN